MLYYIILHFDLTVHGISRYYAQLAAPKRSCWPWSSSRVWSEDIRASSSAVLSFAVHKCEYLSIEWCRTRTSACSRSSYAGSSQCQLKHSLRNDSVLSGWHNLNLFRDSRHKSRTIELPQDERNEIKRSFLLVLFVFLSLLAMSIRQFHHVFLSSNKRNRNSENLPIRQK